MLVDRLFARLSPVVAGALMLGCLALPLSAFGQDDLFGFETFDFSQNQNPNTPGSNGVGAEPLGPSTQSLQTQAGAFINFEEKEPTGVLFTEPLGNENLGEGAVVVDPALIPTDFSLQTLKNSADQSQIIARLGIGAYASMFYNDEETDKLRRELAFQAAMDLRDPPIQRPVVQLRAMDKITARMTSIRVPVGSAIQFGTMTIAARACFENPPTETPESASFLEIIDKPVARPAYDVFSGWMFASSPALSAMDHAIYDVWVEGCIATGA